MMTAEQAWDQYYESRHGVPKPIKGTSDYNEARSAYIAGYEAVFPG